nr:MaoC family dehydratase [Variovorax paradoxus]
MSAAGINYPPTLQLRTEPISPVQLALFAAASGDHNPLHLDPQVARRAGFDQPVVHGMLTMAMAGRLFTRQLGAGCIRALNTRFSGVALAGDTLELVATLESADGGSARYQLRATTGAGKDVLAGSAEVTRRART